MTFYATSMAATMLVQYRKSFDWTLTEGNPLSMLARGTENGQSFLHLIRRDRPLTQNYLVMSG